MQQYRRKNNLIKVLQGVFAAIFGVQSSKNAKKDFEEGIFWHYAVAGLVVFISCILTIYFIVSSVLIKYGH